MKPKTANQIKKITLNKQKRDEKLKKKRKLKNKKKEVKKLNVFFNKTQHKKCSEETAIESKYTNWISLAETLLNKTFEHKNYELNVVKHSLTKIIKDKFLPENLNEQIYLSNLNKLQTFTNEEYNDIFASNQITNSKEQLSEEEVKLKYFYYTH